MPQTVLIFRTGQLGDTLVSMPAIHAIRKRHPGCTVVLLTDRHPGSGFVSSWDVLGESGWIDEVEFYVPGTGILGMWRNASQLSARLRGRSVTHAYLLTSGRTPWQRWRDRLFVRFVIGARHCHDASGPPVSLKAVDGLLVRLEPEWRRLLGAISVDGGDRFELPVSPAAGHEAEIALAAIGPTEGARLVAFGPGSKMPAKVWPAERYEEVGRRLLAARDNVELVVLGGPEDAAVGNRLCAAWGPRSHNLAGRVSVMAGAAVLRHCSAYVGNDTGTMHLAAMAGVPCIALFSARDNPGKWEPYGEGHTVLRREVDCAGCMLEVCNVQANKCLRLITVEEVLGAVEGVLHQKGGET